MEKYRDYDVLIGAVFKEKKRNVPAPMGRETYTGSQGDNLLR